MDWTLGVDERVLIRRFRVVIRLSRFWRGVDVFVREDLLPQVLELSVANPKRIKEIAAPRLVTSRKIINRCMVILDIDMLVGVYFEREEFRSKFVVNFKQSLQPFDEVIVLTTCVVKCTLECGEVLFQSFDGGFRTFFLPSDVFGATVRS